MPNTVKEIISVAQAARRLGRGTAVIQYGLRSGQLPFGTAFISEGGQYVYIIPCEAFEKYMRGEFERKDNT